MNIGLINSNIIRNGIEINPVGGSCVINASQSKTILPSRALRRNFNLSLLCIMLIMTLSWLLSSQVAATHVPLHRRRRRRVGRGTGARARTTVKHLMSLRRTLHTLHTLLITFCTLARNLTIILLVMKFTLTADGGCYHRREKATTEEWCASSPARCPSTTRSAPRLRSTKM